MSTFQFSHQAVVQLRHRRSELSEQDMVERVSSGFEMDASAVAGLIQDPRGMPQGCRYVLTPQRDGLFVVRDDTHILSYIPLRYNQRKLAEALWGPRYMVGARFVAGVPVDRVRVSKGVASKFGNRNRAKKAIRLGNEVPCVGVVFNPGNQILEIKAIRACGAEGVLVGFYRDGETVLAVLVPQPKIDRSNTRNRRIEILDLLLTDVRPSEELRSRLKSVNPKSTTSRIRQMLWEARDHIQIVGSHAEVALESPVGSVVLCERIPGEWWACTKLPEPIPEDESLWAQHLRARGWKCFPPPFEGC